MKGAALADRYPEPGLRPMDDVDILLPRRDHDGCVRVLEAAGWERRTHSRAGTTRPCSPIREVPGLPLELHRAFATWTGRANRLSAPDAVGATSATHGRWASPPSASRPRTRSCRSRPTPPSRSTCSPAAVDHRPRRRRSSGGDRRGRRSTGTGSRRVAAARCRTGGRSRPRALAERLGAAVAGRAASRARRPARAARPRSRRCCRRSGRSPNGTTASATGLRYALVDDPRLRVALLGESVFDTSPVNATRKATATSVRLVRRWRQLRRSGRGREPGGRAQGRAMTGCRGSRSCIVGTAPVTSATMPNSARPRSSGSSSQTASAASRRMLSGRVSGRAARLGRRRARRGARSAPRVTGPAGCHGAMSQPVLSTVSNRGHSTVGSGFAVQAAHPRRAWPQQRRRASKVDGAQVLGDRAQPASGESDEHARLAPAARAAHEHRPTVEGAGGAVHDEHRRVMQEQREAVGRRRTGPSPHRCGRRQ